MITLAKYLWNQVHVPAPTLEEEYEKLKRAHDMQWRQLGESSDEEDNGNDDTVEIGTNQVYSNRGMYSDDIYTVFCIMLYIIFTRIVCMMERTFFQV